MGYHLKVSRHFIYYINDMPEGFARIDNVLSAVSYLFSACLHALHCAFCILLDLSDEPFSGRVLQERCDEIGITLNKNCVPNEKRSPKETSGVRIGTAPMTTRGYKEEDFVKVVQRIDALIKGLREEYK